MGSLQKLTLVKYQLNKTGRSFERPVSVLVIITDLVLLVSEQNFPRHLMELLECRIHPA